MAFHPSQQQQQQQQQQQPYIDTFDVFEGVNEVEEKSSKVMPIATATANKTSPSKGESNPWSDSTWGDGTTTPTPSSTNLEVAFPTTSDVDTSFDSHSAFEFSAEAAPFGYNPFAGIIGNGNNASGGTPKKKNATDMLFPPDPMADLSGDDLNSVPGETTVRVAIREQFSTIYDDAGSTPSCHLEGSIFVQPSSMSFNLDSNTAFCVVVKDSHGYIDNLEEVPTVSTDITSTSDREKGDTVFRVSLPENTLMEVPIASYICNPQLRPIPMLVKSRVQVTDDVSRVGFKVRANPSNTEPLNNMVILIAVPPFVQGESVKMSRKGGVWDEMKRTICWTVDKLEPGEVLEIQAQFQSGNLQNLAHVDLQFPVLVRADVPRLFSGISISTAYENGGDEEKEEDSDPSIIPVKNILTQCTRILHRKV